MIDVHRAKAYCCEDISQIENYTEAIVDTTQMWHCHHRRECVDGVFTSRKDLIVNSLYYNRPAEELIFLTKSDHRRLHSKNPATWKKISESLKGEKNYMYGKPAHNRGKKFSDEMKKKISENTKRAMADPAIKQKMSDAHKRPEIKQKLSNIRKRTWLDPEYQQKIRKARANRRWYTDGINNRYVAECPGEGWHLGMTKHKKLTY